MSRRAAKQYEFFSKDPSHPSLRLKQVGSFWFFRISVSCRALAIRNGNEFTWFWIGTHDDYKRMIS